jgi:hypothetical protein
MIADYHLIQLNRHSNIMKNKLAVLVACAAANLGVYAAEPPTGALETGEPVAAVAVTGIKNPALQPYRTMSAGLDAFEQFRRVAPSAVLKFELNKLDDSGGPRTDWSDVTLRISGQEVSLPLTIASDGTFILPRSQQAYDEDADLLTNQRKGALIFSPRVYTPGLPPNTRRLGDFRLECQVLIAIGKKELGLAQRMAFAAMFGTTDWCSARRAQIASVWPEWPISITQIDGALRTPVPTQGSRFFAPIQDKSLADDTLYEFEFWSKASPERKRQYIAQWPLSVKTSMNKWGPGAPLEADGNHVYKATMILQPGDWKFNFESQGREIGFGAKSGNTSADAGIPHPLLWHGSKHLTFMVEQAGQFDFSLDLHDLDHPTISIRRAD